MPRPSDVTLRARIIALLREAPCALSVNEIIEGTRGSGWNVRRALDRLMLDRVIVARAPTRKGRRAHWMLRERADEDEGAPRPRAPNFAALEAAWGRCALTA